MMVQGAASHQRHRGNLTERISGVKPPRTSLFLLTTHSIASYHAHFSYRTPKTDTTCDLDLNHLTPNGHYMGRTAQLTSRCCVLYIYSTNIRTEYFKTCCVISTFLLFKMPFISQCYLFWFLYYSHFKYRLF